MRGKVITIKSGNETFKATANLPDAEPVPDIVIVDGETYVRSGLVFKRAVGDITMFHRVKDEKQRAGK